MTVSPVAVNAYGIDPVAGDTEFFEPVTPFQKMMYANIKEMVGEVRATRQEIAELRAYVVALEEKASQMASPEKMQEMLSGFMGGMF